MLESNKYPFPDLITKTDGSCWICFCFCFVETMNKDCTLLYLLVYRFIVLLGTRIRFIWRMEKRIYFLIHLWIYVYINYLCLKLYIQLYKYVFTNYV